MKSLYYRITGPASDFVMKWNKYFAAAMLLLMFGLGMGSMLGNSAIVDELAHIPAGYSYLKYGDYRLNPEHPPLIKDIAALPLMFMNLKFPHNQPSWTTEVNGEWDVGYAFLYNLGNNANAILFWSQLPILLIAIIFGGWFYWIVKRRWGVAVALLTLFFYCLSPNFIGHATIVTTDVGVSVFIMLALITFGRYVQNPTVKNMFLLSLAIAGAELSKFSAALLYPFMFLMSILLLWIARNPKTLKERVKAYVGGWFAASALSALWIYLFYWPHVINMPTSVQDKLIAGSLVSPNDTQIAQWLQTASHWFGMKPAVQYVLGLVMDTGRVEGGNVTYFNGQVTDQSFKWYFPETFAVKTQIAFLILMVVALVFLVWCLRRPKTRALGQRLVDNFRRNLLEWSFGLFVILYFSISVVGNLDLGIRHILPIYLPLFVLVALATVRISRKLGKTKWKAWAAGILLVLLAWYGGSTIAAYPTYIGYFNEFIGGTNNVDKYFSDSSIDWGQDLLRLVAYVKAHPQIKQIAVDYFGGGLPQYYFCQRVYSNGHLVTDGTYNCNNSPFIQWHSSYGKPPYQYIAVSETYLENDRYYSSLANQEGYTWLRKLTPIAKIGYSIYVYKLY